MAFGWCSDDSAADRRRVARSIPHSRGLLGLGISANRSGFDFGFFRWVLVGGSVVGCQPSGFEFLPQVKL